MISTPRIASALAVIAAVLLIGCSGSESASDATVATTTPAPADSTTTSSTTTTEAPATTSTTTTSSMPSTTVVTTTEPPETTTASTPEPTDKQVADGLIASREAYLYGVYNLDADDALERINETHAAGSPSLDLALDNIQTLIDNGWLARPNPDIPDTITIESDATMIDDTTAELVACVVGAGEVYAPGANEDGSDLIINGEIEAALNRVTMVLEDGRWKVREGTNLTTESGTECVVE